MSDPGCGLKHQEAVRKEKQEEDDRHDSNELIRARWRRVTGDQWGDLLLTADKQVTQLLDQGMYITSVTLRPPDDIKIEWLE